MHPSTSSSPASSSPSSSRGRRCAGRALAVVAVLVALGGTACDPLPPPPPGGTAADCRDIAWGSGQKDASPMSLAPITGVRAAGHRCYDRFVIDLGSTPAPGWHVRYHAVEQPGTGDVVPVRGGAAIEIVALAPAYDTAGHATFHPANPNELVPTAGDQTFRQAVYAGSFEGQSTFGLGVRARLPFRVFALSDAHGTRLVVDVAHRWA